MYYVVVYLLIITLLAYLVEKQKIPSLIHNNSIIYALSFSVLMTGWTYYGNVEKAAHHDSTFWAAPVGILFSSILWWVVLKKLVKIKEKYKINSLSDFISLRYKKSQSIAILVSIVCCIAIIPYIALQWNATFASLELISNVDILVEIITVLLMGAFIIFIGIRKLDPTEHHRGIIFVIAIEGIIKLIAVLVLLLFIFFILHKNPFHFFKEIQAIIPHEFPAPNLNFYSYWTTLAILTMSAVIFLPRQFHVAVVENQKVEHIKTAMWIFPLYVFFLTIPAFFIAWQGIIDQLPIQKAKDFPILIPFKRGYTSIGLITFIGGLSACFGMIILSTITVTTMISNHIILPLTTSIGFFKILNQCILCIRWIIAFFILTISYLFYKFFAYSPMLITTGILAFTAAFQFVPSIIGGLFWKRANKAGAFFGISSGFLVWIFTILLPYMEKYGQIKSIPLPFKFSLFPLHPIAQGTFLSFFVNSSLFIILSLIIKQDSYERKIADEVVNIEKNYEYSLVNDEKTVDLDEKIPILLDAIKQVLPEQKSLEIIFKVIKDVTDNRKVVSLLEFQEIINRLENFVAGIFGSATAHKIITNSHMFSEEEKQALSLLYSKILTEINMPIEELRRRIDYYQEKEKLLKKHTKELESLLSIITHEKQKLSAIIESIKEGIICYDKDGKVLIINNEAGNILNVSLDVLKNNPITHLFNLFEQGEQLNNAYISGYNFYWLETKVKNSTREVEVAFSPILKSQDEYTGIVVVIRDISYKKIAEREIIKAEKLSSLGIIAGGIAHDFNNLLASIMGNLELILLNNDVEKIKQLASKTLNAIERAKGLTRQLLTFSKGGAPVKEVVSFKDLLVDTVKFTLSGANITCNFSIQKDLWNIYADRDQISQVFQNLALNAKEAMETGGILEVYAENFIINEHPNLKSGPYVKIIFRDHGTGIDSKYLSKIFDPYFTTKKKGLGLGLSICYSIIKRHKGTIEVESTKGKGTTFYIYLPAVTDKKEEDIKDINIKPSLKQDKTLLKEKRILILEDEKEIQELLSNFFEMNGFEVEAVDKGEEAISKYKQAKNQNRPFDVVIMDLTIPHGMGGKECIKHLKDFDPDVVAIVMSGYSDDPVMANYKKYGFKERIKKPFSLEELMTKILALI